jgi:hypothetical protein
MVLPQSDSEVMRAVFNEELIGRCAPAIVRSQKRGGRWVGLPTITTPQLDGELKALPTLVTAANESGAKMRGEFHGDATRVFALSVGKSDGFRTFARGHHQRCAAV